MARFYQVRTRIDPSDGATIIDCLRFNQFSGIKAGAYEDASGWHDGYDPNASNDTDGTPIGTPDADLVAVAESPDPLLVQDTDGPAGRTDGSGPELEGENYTVTITWP